MSDTPADVVGFYASQLGVDEAAAESVLWHRRWGAAARSPSCTFEHKRSGSLSFEDQQVKSTQASLSQGVGIRVVEGDAIGYAYTEDLVGRRHAPRGRDGRSDRARQRLRLSRST